MQRTTHNLIQGSAEWHEHRASHYGASDAPAMMGASKYRSRADLLREKATGIAPEISGNQQELFDRGHVAEATIRPVVETMLSDDLYPVTMSAEVDGLPLSASLDGLNLNGDIIFECKLWNESLAEQVRLGNLDPHYYWQLEQQLLVSGAERVIFATGDGGDRLETMYYCAVPGRAEALIAGWKQFQQDVAAYEPPQITEPPPVGAHIDSLPALRVEVEGKVLATNLDQFRANAMQILGSINRDLKTDQDFADAEQAVKDCKVMEDRLDAAKANVLAQMQSVDEVCRTIDSVSAETRKVRLELDRLVKAEKEHRRAEIVAGGVAAVREHYVAINATLGAHALGIPASLASDIGASIKGRKTLTSIRDAVDTAVAAAKIEASQQAERVRQNIAVLDEFAEHAHLFADRVSLAASKTPEDLRNLCATRVAEHQHREAEKLEAERARIRAEEQAKAERAERLRQQAIAETERARQEEAARIEREQQAQPIPEVATPAAVATAHSEQAPTTAVRSGAKIKLGDINTRIAPLSISADGLSQLGFEPVEHQRSAKLYAAADLPAILRAMVDVLQGRLPLRKTA